MPVELITEKLVMKPNHVFIIPEDRELHVFDGEFRLKPISKRLSWPDVVTVFLRSLVDHWEGKLVAVILSGFDGDRAPTFCAIRKIGGATIAQNLSGAGVAEMTESAMATGCIDFLLPPEGIADKILEIVQASKSNMHMSTTVVS